MVPVTLNLSGLGWVYARGGDQNYEGRILVSAEFGRGALGPAIGFRAQG